MADRLEGRNPVLECLVRGRRRVHKILLDRGARDVGKIARILELAEVAGVPVQRVDRFKLDQVTDGRVHNGVIAEAEGLPSWTTRGLIDHIFDEGRSPFIVLCSELAYEHNLGAVLRSSLGFGVDGVVLPTRKGARVSPVVQRVAMGAVEEVPVVREGMNSSLKHIRKAGIVVVGADMGGEPMNQVDLSGPVALLMGGEGSGLSSNLRQRCDRIVSVPLAGQLESLNVSVAAALLMYEKRRQDGWFDPPAAEAPAADEPV